MANNDKDRYSSIQVSKTAQNILRRRKRAGESYEDYFRRKGLL